MNMRMNRKIAAMVAAAVALVAIASTGGCANSTELDPTPVRTFKITPAASPRTVAVRVTPTAAPTPAQGGGGSALDLVGRDTKLDTAALVAGSGIVTIRFDNQDAGVVHNLHVFRGTDAQGASIGQTKLEAGPVKQELSLTLDKGTYYYQCDAHPTTMKGQLTVQ